MLLKCCSTPGRGGSTSSLLLILRGLTDIQTELVVHCSLRAGQTRRWDQTWQRDSNVEPFNSELVCHLALCLFGGLVFWGCRGF